MTQKYYKIVTYGCQMNVHESEKLAGMLKSLDYKETNDNAKADVIVFNTCTIREGAADKAFGNIGALKKLKKQKPNLIIAVCGCMTQVKADAEKLKKTFKFVNIIFGTHNLYKFKQYLIDYKLTKTNMLEIWDNEDGVPPSTDIYRTSGQNGWINITYGCNNFCSYCIVPYVRGRERSRDFNGIIEDAKELIAKGYKIITLLGQNVNSYGNDIEDKSVTFANLIDTIAKLDGDFRLKFMTSHPKDLSDEVIMAIANNKKISKTIHLPVQSGSNAVLKSMNRRYTLQHYKGLVDKIRKHIPNVTLSSDFIVGFPGETDEDFEKTCELVKYANYDFIFAYMYSKRSGTIAAEMENQVPLEIKKIRVNKLLAVEKEIVKINRPKQVGKIVEVLLTKKLEDGKFECKCDSGKQITVLADNMKENNFYNVKITKVEGSKQTGELV